MFPFETLPGLLRYACATYDHPRALSYPQPGEWVRYTHRDLERRVRHLTLGLEDLGIGRGESVGLIAPSSPDWVVIDLAIQAVGAVTVPIFNKISVESFTHEIRDSGMRYLFAGNPDEIPMVHEHAADLVHTITFWYSGTHELFDGLFKRGSEIERERPGRFAELCDAVKAADVATIIYTSGSTGLPKGVVLTQRNIVSQIQASAERFPREEQNDCLSMLPLAHIFERMVVYFYVAHGYPVFFVDDPKRVAEYLRVVRPAVITVVPRILEKVETAMGDRQEAARGPLRALLRGAFARARTKDVDRPFRRPLDVLYTRLVYPKLREALGGRIRYAISGSSKLQVGTARFFTNIGVPVYEGYGLTEASPVITANGPGRRRVGTVGLPLSGVEVRIAPDGEILARGPNTMLGYHNSPQATGEVLDGDGWLHTGDLGSVDVDGYLTLTGRKKELFKKSTGEYVPPGPIEYALSRIPYVDTGVIVADGRVYVTALLFPDLDRLNGFKSKFGLSDMSAHEFLRSDFLRRKTQEYVDEVNAHRHHCERIERFHILDHPASIETGELTPSLKVRRFHVEEIYKAAIDNMYASIGGWK